MRQKKVVVCTNTTDELAEIYGVPLFGSNRSKLLSWVGAKSGKGPIWIATVNPEFVMNALKDSQFLKVLQEKTTVNVMDGIGLVWAQEIKHQKSRVKRLFLGLRVGLEILRGGHRGRLITGADLIDELCKEAAKNGKTVFFLGGWGDRGSRTAKYFKEKYPKLVVAGSYAGNRVGEDEKTLKILSKKKIDYLFVAYAMKTQEEWIDRNLDKLKVKLVMGVGRSFDYYSGDLTRAPEWVRHMGMEWLYSLVTDKGRRKRKLELVRFFWRVLTE